VIASSYGWAIAAIALVVFLGLAMWWLRQQQLREIARVEAEAGRLAAERETRASEAARKVEDEGAKRREEIRADRPESPLIRVHDDRPPPVPPAAA
jgi:uncharacterized protein HemX